jgi:hypothetical protein
MFQPWQNGFNYAPVDFEKMVQYHELLDVGRAEEAKAVYADAFKYCVSPENRKGNDRYKAAYDFFKREIANAVATLPYKEGMDANTGKIRDVMLNTRQFLQGIRPENKELIQSMRDAFNIFWSVFKDSYSNHIRDYINFFEIVKEEFMKIGELLPTMGDDDMSKPSMPYIKELNREINVYRNFEKHVSSDRYSKNPAVLPWNLKKQRSA